MRDIRIKGRGGVQTRRCASTSISNFTAILGGKKKYNAYSAFGWSVNGRYVLESLKCDEDSY